MAALPFHPHEAGFHRENALYLAHAADVAYRRSPEAEALLRLGLRATPFVHGVTRTRGYVGVCDTHAVLGFRGSDPVTLPNWITDSIAPLTVVKPYDGRVHLGFATALEQSWDEICERLVGLGERPLFVTGHSLGGALAKLAAHRLTRLGKAPRATYTFGAPRVGNRRFCEQYVATVYRVVNRLDMIPEYPVAAQRTTSSGENRPVGAGLLDAVKNLADDVFFYDHVQTLVHIGLDGCLTVGGEAHCWTTTALARAVATRGASFHEGLTDHLVSNYIRGLERGSEKP